LRPVKAEERPGDDRDEQERDREGTDRQAEVGRGVRVCYTRA